MGGREAGDGRLKVRVVSVGRDRSGLFQPIVDEYANRLRHYTRIELIELPEYSAKKLPPGRAKQEEAKAILGRVPATDWLIALDERGKQMDSMAFSQLIARAQNQSKDLTFVIGGDEGLDASILERAQTVLSLGKMTLPHRLARAVLMEQIYRAFTLIKGEPYHR